MTDRTIELIGPPRFGEEGPYWVGSFNVTEGASEPQPVRLKLNQHAEAIFARALSARPIEPELLARIIERCGQEKVGELLEAGAELPAELSLAGPGAEQAVVITHAEAQRMLTRWGLIVQAVDEIAPADLETELDAASAAPLEVRYAWDIGVSLEITPEAFQPAAASAELEAQPAVLDAPATDQDELKAAS